MIKVIESECRCSICGKYSARLYCRECAKKSTDGHCGRLKRKVDKEKKLLEKEEKIKIEKELKGKKWKKLSKNGMNSDIF